MSFLLVLVLAPLLHASPVAAEDYRIVEVPQGGDWGPNDEWIPQSPPSSDPPVRVALGDADELARLHPNFFLTGIMDSTTGTVHYGVVLNRRAAVHKYLWLALGKPWPRRRTVGWGLVTTIDGALIPHVDFSFTSGQFNRFHDVAGQAVINQPALRRDIIENFVDQTGVHLRPGRISESTGEVMGELADYMNREYLPGTTRADYTDLITDPPRPRPALTIVGGSLRVAGTALEVGGAYLDPVEYVVERAAERVGLGAAAGVALTAIAASAPTGNLNSSDASAGQLGFGEDQAFMEGRAIAAARMEYIRALNDVARLREVLAWMDQVEAARQRDIEDYLSRDHTLEEYYEWHIHPEVVDPATQATREEVVRALEILENGGDRLIPVFYPADDIWFPAICWPRPGTTYPARPSDCMGATASPG